MVFVFNFLWLILPVEKYNFDLLPFYAILRSIPNKLLGVIAMFSAILIILALPFTDLGRSRGLQFRPLSKIAFYIFVANFLILMQLGAKHVESPFIEFGQISTVLYFAHFLVIVPVVSLIENSLVDLHLQVNIKNNQNIINKQGISLFAILKSLLTPIIVVLVIYMIISILPKEIIVALLGNFYKHSELSLVDGELNPNTINIFNFFYRKF
jgi:hypothetical protein